MSLNQTPKGSRTHLAIFGRRNVGKSSFLNVFIDQELSIVSETPGTTTDPVEKAYELQPFGPVLLIDTAGIDDVGELGKKRIEKTREIIKRTDFAFLLVDKLEIGDFEREIIGLLQKQGTPWLFIVNKVDQLEQSGLAEFIDQVSEIFKTKVLTCSALKKEGLEIIKEEAVKQLEVLTPDPPIIADLVTPPATVVLVVPIDKEAPKGRLILPQVQTIRELLDADIACVVVKERELFHTLNHVLKEKPKIVVTDSQAFLKVNADVPGDILMTSFSILFARQKGDLEAYVNGAKAIDTLKNGDNVLVAELCSHRPITEDIGRIKTPRWLKQYKGINVNFEYTVGKDFPVDLSKYKLIIQCGGCVVNRKLIISRIREAQKQNVPITNYGICIAKILGVLERALEPFRHL